jgi:hypothetical protein
METPSNQVAFLQKLRAQLNAQQSLPDELCRILHISEDSAYRRIRGEKQLSIDELAIICRHYKVSADDPIKGAEHHVLFDGQYILPEQFNFSDYLNAQEKELTFISNHKPHYIRFLCKDIPVYHYFHFPEIASFKYFSWMRTLLNFPSLQQQKFSLLFLKEEIVRQGKRLAELYYQIPGTEILNADNILTTLRQIEYFKDAGLFETPDDLAQVYQSLDAMVDHIRHMASEGRKFLPGKDPSLSGGNYDLYINSFYVGDNTLTVTAGDRSFCFIVHSGINFVRTPDASFCNYQQKFIDQLIRRSTLISTVAEREREQFFISIKNRIRAYRDSNVQTLGKI